MRLSPGRLAGMVKDTLSEDGGHIACHSTIYGPSTQRAICRGWWDRYAAESFLLRLAQAMNIVTYIDPPPEGW
jgi:hypothetical protein